jgi:hypothetical protein
MIVQAYFTWRYDFADIPADLNANEIVRRMVQRNQERARDLQAFTGYRRYRLEYRGFKMVSRRLKFPRQ